MKLRNLPYLLLAIVALASLPAPDAYAQRMFPSSDPATAVLTADDTDTAFLIKFVGSNPFSSVTVTAGDVLLKYGTASADTADTTITRCGATDGTLDVDDADCNTLGELIDSINVSANWRAVPVDGLRSDLVSGATLVAFAATNGSLGAGLAVKWDTSVNFEATQCLNCSRDITTYLAGRGNVLAPGFTENPFAGKQAAFVVGQFTSTYASGTSTIQIVSSKPKFSAPLGTAAETVTTLAGFAGGATATMKELNYHPYGILGKKDERLLVRINNSAAASAITFYAYGESWTYR